MQRRLLYVSRLARGVRYDALAAISRVSRANNPLAGISGALVFDGQRFCQLLDGPQEPIARLWTRIRADPRHDDIVVLHYRAHAIPDPPRGAWVSGYCAPHDLDCFEGEDGLRGTAALGAMYDILARADLA